MNWYKKAMAIPTDLSPEEQEWIKKRYLYEHDIYTFRITQKVVKKLNDYFDFGMSVPLSVYPKRRPLYDRTGLGPMSPKLWKQKITEQPYIQIGPRGRTDAEKGSKWFKPSSREDFIRLIAHEASHSWTHSHGDPMRVSEEALIPTITKLWEEAINELNLKEENGIYELV